MLRMGKLLGRWLLFGLIGFSLPVSAQSNDRQAVPREDSMPSRTIEASELAKENLDRVAASTAQVQAVLLKDPGILVELKNWIAKEATDRKSTRLNSSHEWISYAVFCLKKKNRK